MRDYARIESGFWTGKTGRQIRRANVPIDDRGWLWTIANFLLTSEHANMIGLYRLPLSAIANDTACPLSKVAYLVGTLVDLGFCSYDPDSEFFWVYEMARFQILQGRDALKPSDLQAKGVARQYSLLPSNPFLFAFWQKYRSAFHIEKARGREDDWVFQPVAKIGPDTHSGSSNRPPETFEPWRSDADLSPQSTENPRGLEDPSKSGTGTGAGTGEKQTASGDADRLGDADKSTVDPDALTDRNGRLLEHESRRRFELFWDAFGFKKGKIEAVGSWLDLFPDERGDFFIADKLFDRVMRAARAESKARPELVRGGGKPKWAFGWLSARRFEDEDLQKSPAALDDAEQAAAKAKREERQAMKDLTDDLKYHGLTCPRAIEEDIDRYRDRVKKKIADFLSEGGKPAQYSGEKK